MIGGRLIGSMCIVFGAGLLFPAGWTAEPRVAPAAQDLREAWQAFLAEDAEREPNWTFPYEHCFRRAAAAHDIPLALLLAVARGESDFDPNARSRANAHGLMQILWPTTAHHLGVYRRSALYDPCTNVEAGTRYLKELLTRYEGDLHLALAAYNYGPKRIRVNDHRIPKGAEWYSGYIYRHLDYVLGQGRKHRPVKVLSAYGDASQLELLAFSEPYRAEAFVQTLQKAAPALRLDWFRAGITRFKVVLLYKNAADLQAGKRLLAQAGFLLN